MLAAMITLILTGLLRGVTTQRALVLKNLALRPQLAVLQRAAPRPPRFGVRGHDHAPLQGRNRLKRKGNA